MTRISSGYVDLESYVQDGVPVTRLYLRVQGAVLTGGSQNERDQIEWANFWEVVLRAQACGLLPSKLR